MTVVIVTVALLIGLALPAVRVFLHSFESESGTKSMISATLASARAIAAKEQRYAGVRFQKAFNSEDPLSALKAPQYMIFIVQDTNIMAYGFRAVEGLAPIKLPDSIGVTDLTLVPVRNSVNPVNPGNEVRLGEPDPNDARWDALINDPREITDATTFSIIFSPSGKLVIHGVRVRNRDGYVDSAANIDVSMDDIFNKKPQVDNRIGTFYQDDYYGVGWSPYPDLGLGPEPSRRSFVVFETEKLNRAYKKGLAWSEYLVKQNRLHINSYTGTIISPD